MYKLLTEGYTCAAFIYMILFPDYILHMLSPIYIHFYFVVLPSLIHDNFNQFLLPHPKQMDDT